MGSTMPDLRAGTTEALFVEGYRLHLRVAMALGDCFEISSTSRPQFA